jgi:hypothetical protein
MQKLYAFNLYRLNENFVASEPVGKDGTRREVYLASAADATIDAMERACARRVEELETALRFYAEARDFHMWDKDNNYVDNGNAVARELMGTST